MHLPACGRWLHHSEREVSSDLCEFFGVVVFHGDQEKLRIARCLLVLDGLAPHDSVVNERGAVAEHRMRIGGVFVASGLASVDKEKPAIAGLVAVLAVRESETKARRLAVELGCAGFEPAQLAAGANPHGSEAVPFSGSIEIVPRFGDCGFEVGRVVGGHH